MPDFLSYLSLVKVLLPMFGHTHWLICNGSEYSVAKIRNFFLLHENDPKCDKYNFNLIQIVIVPIVICDKMFLESPLLTAEKMNRGLN
jgi:hypothetical protein